MHNLCTEVLEKECCPTLNWLLWLQYQDLSYTLRKILQWNPYLMYHWVSASSYITFTFLIKWRGYAKLQEYTIGLLIWLHQIMMKSFHVSLVQNKQ
jgi:hypothetical protein